MAHKPTTIEEWELLATEHFDSIWRQRAIIKELHSEIEEGRSNYDSVYNNYLAMARARNKAQAKHQMALDKITELEARVERLRKRNKQPAPSIPIDLPTA